jgi:hypothetical protein
MTMGGKGGGGGASYEDSLNMINDPTMNAYQKQEYEKQKPKFASEEAFYKNYGVDPATMRPGSSIDEPSYRFSRDVFTKLYGAYKPPAAAAAAAAPAAAPTPPAAPVDNAVVPAPTASEPDASLGDPLNPGGAIAQPTSLGNQLGDLAGAQNFWVGGIDSTKNTKSGTGSLKTTQT